MTIRSKPFTCNYEDKLNVHSVCNNPVKYEVRIQVDTGVYGWIAFCGRHARSIAKTTGAKKPDIRPVKVIK
jgi:hypothetical protein